QGNEDADDPREREKQERDPFEEARIRPEARERGEEGEAGREEEHRQRDAVDAEEGAEQREGFDEGAFGRFVREGHGEADGQQELEARDRGEEPSGEGIARLAEEAEPEGQGGADQGEEDQAEHHASSFRQTTRAPRRQATARP